MTTFFVHPCTILKCSPKGEGVYPIPQGDIKSTRNYFDEQITKLENGKNPSIKITDNLEFYFSAHKEIISETEENIKRYYSEASNRNAALGLLVINNEGPTKPDIKAFYEFSELEKESVARKESLEQAILVRKEMLKKITEHRDYLKEIKKDIEGFRGDLIDFTGNKFKEKDSKGNDLLDKINIAIPHLTSYIEDKANFFHVPTLAISEEVVNLIDKGFNNIKAIYLQKEALLAENKKIISERKSFISQAISELNKITEKLIRKSNILANEPPLEVQESIKNIATCIANLTEKEKNITLITEADYQTLISEYEMFSGNINQNLNNYSQAADNAIKERRMQLSQEKHAFITEIKIKEFRENLADEILSEFEQASIYKEYSELVNKIDLTRGKSCIFFDEIEKIKKATTQFLPKIKQFKTRILFKGEEI